MSANNRQRSAFTCVSSRSNGPSKRRSTCATSVSWWSVGEQVPRRRLTRIWPARV